ncbi:MAG: hypothetical protein Q4D89_11500 [Arachnia propionica]|uniref:hypothetical protein n=1 Tax=Arachnia propionica TaxID=1750 RepID=UPI00270D1DB6|nr:hypothetical protein [Arachnia propionica]
MNRITVRVAAAAMALAVAFGASACAGGKPSKDELRAAFEKAVGPHATEGEMREKREELMTCLVDQLHEKLSAEGLKKLIEDANNGDSSKESYEELSEEDRKAMDEIGKVCNPLEG